MKRLSVFSHSHRPGPHGAASRSQALLEFALALPILLMLLFGIIDLAALFQAWLTVENIARQTVRYAVTGQYDPAFCVDSDDEGSEACAGAKYEEEQDAARLLSIQQYADRQTVALFFTPGAAQHEIGHLNTVICSTRDDDPEDNISDFVFFASSSADYADCRKNGLHEEDAGAPGDRVIIAVDFNHPYITPIFNKVWPMTHLFSHREGIVEEFRIPRLIALPENPFGPSPTASNTPPATETGTATATATDLPPIHIEIIDPETSPKTISNISDTRFEAIAWDPNVGTTNGRGINSITFWFQGPGTINGSTERQLAYCAFSGNGPCNPMTYTGQPNGTYTIFARALANDGRYSEIVSKQFILNFPPTPTPTFTPIPSCNDVFITGVEIRNYSSSSELRVTIRNNNLASGWLTSSIMTWDSLYSPPLAWDYYWFLNSDSPNRYYNPSGTLTDSTPTISWSDATGAKNSSGNIIPLAGSAKTIWGARFSRNNTPVLAGNFNIWLTFYFPDLGECARSTTLFQPTPTITTTPTRTLIPTVTATRPTPTRTLVPPPTNTRTNTPVNPPQPTRTPTRFTSTPRPPTQTLTPGAPTATPTIKFDG